MNRQPFEKPPQWWSPKLSGRWVNFWRRFRYREQRKKHRLVEIEVHGVGPIRNLLNEGCGMLITPNHSSHADSFVLYEAADRLGVPIYTMVAWQVFQRSNWLRKTILRQHGCFSIDREGTDIAALRQAREILRSEPYPLAIFPEGEVYHLNDRVTPFREGPAAIALMAAKKSSRPISCVPCAMTYRYAQDPTPELQELMSRLEAALTWRPRPDLQLHQRIYHLAEGITALKEIEILGSTSEGRLPDRIQVLIEFLLGRLEARHGLSSASATVPERVKAARRHVIKCLEDVTADSGEAALLHEELDDLFLVVQAFSYPGDYVAESPCVERMAETLDKFEEDLLGMPTASIRGTRRADVVFGEPLILPAGGAKSMSATDLTSTLEQRVQNLLHQPAAASVVDA
jgi:hypothetical protein